MVMFHLVSSKAIINSIHVIIKYFLNKKLSVICIWELKWSSFVLPGPRGGNFHQASCVWIWEPAQARRLQFWSGTTCLSPNKTKIVNFLMIYMVFIYSLLNYLLRKTKNVVPTLAKTLLQREQISRTCCSLKEQFRIVKLRSLENGSKMDCKVIW